MKDRILIIDEFNLEKIIAEVVGRFAPTHHTPDEDEWIGEKEAMFLLRIRSKTTMQKLRNEGLVRYSKLSRKHLLYSRFSIRDYLEENARDTF